MPVEVGKIILISNVYLKKVYSLSVNKVSCCNGFSDVFTVIKNINNKNYDRNTKKIISVLYRYKTSSLSHI